MSLPLMRIHVAQGSYMYQVAQQHNLVQMATMRASQYKHIWGVISCSAMSSERRVESASFFPWPDLDAQSHKREQAFGRNAPPTGTLFSVFQSHIVWQECNMHGLILCQRNLLSEIKINLHIINSLSYSYFCPHQTPDLTQSQKVILHTRVPCDRGAGVHQLEPCDFQLCDQGIMSLVKLTAAASSQDCSCTLESPSELHTG